MRKEAEVFWEDRHRLSAIARRTSGFKINEDVVIPMQRIPDFALFLEQLNLECSATAYRQALQELGRLPGMALEDKGSQPQIRQCDPRGWGGVLPPSFPTRKWKNARWNSSGSWPSAMIASPPRSKNQRQYACRPRCGGEPHARGRREPITSISRQLQ